MFDYDYIIDILSAQDEEEVSEPHFLYLEDIRPEDLPPKDESFPQKLPNKRVIIIDIW